MMKLRVKGREYEKRDGGVWWQCPHDGEIEKAWDDLLDALAVAVAELREEEHHSGDPSTRRNAEAALKEIEGE